MFLERDVEERFRLFFHEYCSPWDAVAAFLGILIFAGYPFLVGEAFMQLHVYALQLCITGCLFWWLWLIRCHRSWYQRHREEALTLVHMTCFVIFLVNHPGYILSAADISQPSLINRISFFFKASGCWGPSYAALATPMRMKAHLYIFTMVTGMLRGVISDTCTFCLATPMLTPQDFRVWGLISGSYSNTAAQQHCKMALHVSQILLGIVLPFVVAWAKEREIRNIFLRTWGPPSGGVPWALWPLVDSHTAFVELCTLFLLYWCVAVMCAPLAGSNFPDFPHGLKRTGAANGTL